MFCYLKWMQNRVFQLIKLSQYLSAADFTHRHMKLPNSMPSTLREGERERESTGLSHLHLAVKI